MIFSIWIGVFTALFVTAHILRSQMSRYQYPGQPPLRFGWRLGFAILVDPNRLTEMGRVYRLWAIRVDVAAMLWGIPGMPIAQILSGHFR